MQCNKHVYDMRRKTPAQLAQLKKYTGGCCVLAYADQVQQADELLLQEKVGRKTKAPYLPLAAGLAALSLLPQVSLSQNNSTQTQTGLTSFRNKEGKNTTVTTDAKTASDKKITVIGTVRKSPNKLSKKYTFELGYQDKGSGEFVLVKTFSSRANGSFKIALTQEEYNTLLKQDMDINCGRKRVSWEEFDLADRSQPLIIDVSKYRFRRHRVMGAYF